MIENKIEEISKDLELFDNDLEKYEYIIDLGKSLEPLDEKYKKEANLVQGCTSKVWLICEMKDDKMIFKADSTAAIVKGLVKILISIFSNQTPKDIDNFNFKYLDRLNLNEIITPNRQSGVQGMLKRIQEYTNAVKD